MLPDLKDGTVLGDASDTCFLTLKLVSIRGDGQRCEGNPCIGTKTPGWSLQAMPKTQGRPLKC